MKEKDFCPKTRNQSYLTLFSMRKEGDSHEKAPKSFDSTIPFIGVPIPGHWGDGGRTIDHEQRDTPGLGDLKGSIHDLPENDHGNR